MTIEVLSVVYSIVNRVFRIFFIFQRLMSSPVTGLLTVCIDTIIVLLCVFGSGMKMRITQWESHGNGNKT